MNKQEKLMEQIKELVANDYVNPGIRTEIIFDCLLTPYIEGILKDQRQIDAALLAKEMSIEKDSESNQGPKIDYVLADKTEKRIILVELKTTDSSRNDQQDEVYRTDCQGKSFGEALGRRLLSILNTKNTFSPLDCLKKEPWGDQTLQDAFQEILCKPFKVFQFPSKQCETCQADLTDEGKRKNQCANCARELILQNKWTQKGHLRSRKYLYTLGKLADYLKENEGETLWDKPIEVFYLTPNGDAPENFQGLSLEVFADRHADSNDPCAKLLSDIIKEIYGAG